MPATRIPRCPVCGALLTTDRTVDERWVRRHPEPDAWVYRLACSACLTIVRVEVPEVNALARAERSRPEVDVAGSVGARLVERLSAVSGPHELDALLEETATDAERHVLLRVPEVLARAFARYATGVRVRHELFVRWPYLVEASPPSLPTGRLVLARSPPRVSLDGEREAVVWAHDGELEIRVAADERLRVAGREGGALLLEPPREGRTPLVEYLAKVESLAVWPDDVAPLPDTEDV